MKKVKNTVVLFITMISIGQLNAQDTLSINEAIMQGMEKNYTIRISRNDLRISANNSTIGNSGLLPVIDASGSFNERVENNVTEFSSPSIPNIDNSGVRTTNLAYGVNATWTIFDGLSSFATLDRLKTDEKISDKQLQLQVEQTLSDIITTYYQIVGTNKAYTVLSNTVEVSGERIRIAETRKDIGSGSEYDLLQARADYNADRAALIRAQTTLKRSKLSLQQILADTSMSEYEVGDEISLAGPLSLSGLLADAAQQNRDLTLTRLNKERSRSELNEIRGEWLPQLDLNGGYNYNRTEASIGFTDFSETSGFRYGITATLNLFDGFNKNRRVQNARISLKNEELRLEEIRIRLNNQIRQIYFQYSDALSLIDLEEENLQYAKESLEIGLERFRLGTINSVELREVQQTLLDAENRLIAAQIEAKTAEIELLRLSGRLLSRQNMD